jgi:hypothetical protein
MAEGRKAGVPGCVYVCRHFPALCAGWRDVTSAIAGVTQSLRENDSQLTTTTMHTAKAIVQAFHRPVRDSCVAKVGCRDEVGTPSGRSL